MPTSPTDPPAATTRAVAAGALVVSVAVTAVTVALDAGNDPVLVRTVAGDVGWTAGVSGTLLAGAGALVLRTSWRHTLGWVLLVMGVHWAVDGLAAAWLVHAVEPAATGGEPLPGAGLAYWVYQRLGASLLLTLPLVLLLFPDGRLPEGHRWRTASLVSLGLTALLPLTLLLVPARVAEAGAGGFPAALAAVDLDPTTLAGVPDDVWEALLRVAFAAVPLSLLVPLASLVRRYRRGDPEQRRRLRWLLWAGTVAAVVMLVGRALPEALMSAGLVASVGVCALAVAAGVTRPRVVDIDALLPGTLVYAVLAAVLLGTDLLVLALAGSLLGGGLGEREAALLALGLVAALYLPLRDRAFRLARRLVLGERDDPYRVVSRLAERVEAAPGTEEELAAVARSVADAFRLPYVGVAVDQPDGSTVLAEHGTAPEAVTAHPLTYREETIGRLLLPAGARGPGAGGRDARLLADVARQAAAAARAAHLAAQLQRHRELLVLAREEERRRLRRDLHDGLGPLLGAVVLRIDTARRLAGAGRVEESDATLREVRDDVAGGLQEVRRLVHDLRPPALDDVGLVGALRQQARRLGTDGLRVDVEVVGDDDALGDLPAAVEVAALRVVSEAVLNVHRHAGATRCNVTLRRDDNALHVAVVDDGTGIAADAPAGVGLLSVRERAAELGGTAHVSCPPDGGTVLRATLPLGRPAVPRQPAPGVSA
ncbi:sensor histidine kinase [Aquipuribacter sp. SD81]|uniref:sensor histidine kinase n=1 Tax=Aquipuribacter sp. SD81 TaxID=3127703 RepID=UPI0030188FCA